MNINMHEVAKQLIENNKEPITSLEEVTDEEVLKQLLQKNNHWLMREFSTGFLLDLYNHLFHLLTVDCLIKIKKSTHIVENVVSYNKRGGKFIPQKVEITEYRYKLAWNYEREKSIPPELGVETDKVELKTPSKHNLLIKINNSFPLKGYFPELGEYFDYNQQFGAISHLVKNIYSLFVSETKQTGTPPSIEFLVNRLIRYESFELAHLGEVKDFANIVDISIDGGDFSAKIEKQFFSANLTELGVVK